MSIDSAIMNYNDNATDLNNIIVLVEEYLHKAEILQILIENRKTLINDKMIVITKLI